MIKKLKTLLGFIFLSIILGWCLHYLNSDKRYKKNQIRVCEKFKEESFNGIIEKCFIDYKNKGVHSFLIAGEEDTITMWYYGNSYLEMGDSIVKEVGKTEYIIYKKNYMDSILVLKFNCNK